MMASLLLALTMLAPQNEQQLRQIQEQLEKLVAKPTCAVELQWVSNNESRRVPPSSTAVVPLHFFAAVSKPEDQCLPVEIRVSVSYLDRADNLICSGVIENVASQTSNIQSINLDLRPYNLQEFARWKNEPPSSNSGPQRLSCLVPDGLSEATPEQLREATTVRVRITSLPPGGGLSTTEVLLDLPR